MKNRDQREKERSQKKKEQKSGKKRVMTFAASAAMLAMLFALTACGGSDQDKKTDREDPSQPPGAESGAQVTAPGDDAQGAADGTENGSYIGTAKAEQIALEHAGLTKTDYLNSHLDQDERVPVYDVEIRAGGYEYDYEIDAVTGKSLHSDKDIDDDQKTKDPLTRS